MRLLSFSVVLVAAVMMGACAQTPATQPAIAKVAAPAFFVPSAAIVHNQTERVHPDQVLPGSDADYFFERYEKVAYGNSAIAEASSYTIYTYDSQPIYIPHTGGSGYRYRWTVQEGATVP